MLKRLAEQTGDKSILPQEVNITPEMLRFWVAFWGLRSRCSLNTGLGGMTYERLDSITVLTYCNLLNVVDEYERERYVRFLGAMDAKFFDMKFSESEKKHG